MGARDQTLIQCMQISTLYFVLFLKPLDVNIIKKCIFLSHSPVICEFYLKLIALETFL